MKIIIYKDQTTGESRMLDVQDRKGLEAQQKMGTAQGLYLGNEYIRGLDILKIQDIKTEPLLGAGSRDGKYCGKCEQGWVYGPEGGRPCGCTPRHAEIVKEYKQYLAKQDWYAGE